MSTTTVEGVMDRKSRDNQLIHGDISFVLGRRACWGQVGYAGQAHAPALGSYAGIDPVRPMLTTIADSGRTPNQRAALANLHPLIAAALFEAGFAAEAGPLST